MPPRGKESIIRRQKEIARQQKQKQKVARREEKRAHGGKEPGFAKDEISPDDMVTVDELTGPRDVAAIPGAVEPGESSIAAKPGGPTAPLTGPSGPGGS